MFLFLLQTVFVFCGAYEIQEKELKNLQGISTTVHKPSYRYEYGVISDGTGDVKNLQEVRDGDHVKGHYHLNDPDGFIRSVYYTVGKDKGFQATVTRQKGNHKIIQMSPQQYKMAHKPRWRRPPIVIEDIYKNGPPYEIDENCLKYKFTQTYDVLQDNKNIGMSEPLKLGENFHRVTPIVQSVNIVDNHAQNKPMVQTIKLKTYHNRNKPLLQPIRLIEHNHQNKMTIKSPPLLKQNHFAKQYLKLMDNIPSMPPLMEQNIHEIPTKHPVKLIEDIREDPMSQRIKSNFVAMPQILPKEQPEIREDQHLKNLLLKPLEVVEMEGYNKSKKRRKNVRNHSKKIKEHPIKMVAAQPGTYIFHEGNQFMVPNYSYKIENMNEINPMPDILESITSILLEDLDASKTVGAVKGITNKHRRIKEKRKSSLYYNLNDVHPRKFVKRHNNHQVGDSYYFFN